MPSRAIAEANWGPLALALARSCRAAPHYGLGATFGNPGRPSRMGADMVRRRVVSGNPADVAAVDVAGCTEPTMEAAIASSSSVAGENVLLGARSLQAALDAGLQEARGHCRIGHEMGEHHPRSDDCRYVGRSLSSVRLSSYGG